MLPGLILISLLNQKPASEAVCYDLEGGMVIPLAKTSTPPTATVLIFYLAHCPIAQKMVPEINRLEQEFAPKKVKIYLIHEDLQLTDKEVAQEAKTFGLTPQVLIDRHKTQMRRSGATISPEAFVYDRNMRLTYKGRISDLFYGLGKMKTTSPTRDLRLAILAVLSKKPTPNVAKPAVGCFLPKFD